MYKNGMQIKVVGNSIFKMMGFQEVTGEIVFIKPDGSGCSIKCNQTRALECVDFDDGEISLIT